MPENKKALGLELRQIIQTDRMAADIIASANHMRSVIEQRAEKEKVEILQEAQKNVKEITRQVEQELAQSLQEKEEEANLEFEKMKRQLQSITSQRKENWIGDITQRITGKRLEPLP